MADKTADYDRVWEEVYGDLQDIGPTHRHMHRIMRRLLHPLQYASVLDVGVGFGHNLPVLTAGRRIERLAGVDISERAIEHVGARYGGEFRRLDIEADHLGGRYDLVCCALVMEHVADDESALRNMRAMTSGYLLIVTIGGDFERYGPWERQMGHVRNYARGELERKLNAAGFEVLRTVYWGFPFYSPVSRMLQNRMTATSELPASARAIARLLYAIYFLNSSRRGDLVVALARPR
jgi:2-polyprenyl-3-methyl-5-hydroxy-6-metoxy-1,4-benzoquinol methylase